MTSRAHEFEPTPAAFPAAGPASDRLVAEELLAVELYARGYSPDQIGALRRVHAVHVLNDLGRAVGVLGAASVREAIEEARRRGLID